MINYKLVGEKKIFLGIFFVAVVVTVGFVFFGGDASLPSGRAAFAACLRDKNVMMFGTDTCPACQTQKGMFDADFQKIHYINCDINQDECTKNGIQKWPTWRYNGVALEGVRTFGELGKLSGCLSP